MQVLNENGELPKGVMILIRQLLKMMNFDPELILGQINGIHSSLNRHVAQQDEILSLLKELKNGQSVSDHNPEQRKLNGGSEQSSRTSQGD